jgi:putative transposase
MTNHYHLLIRAEATGFAAGMQLLNCGHARRMNRKHGRTGHLFRNHYSWRAVESDEHLLETIRYIVLNPVRARICPAPENWRWSSYRATMDLDLPPDFLALADLLALFGTTPGAARDAFRTFVAQGTQDMFKCVR